MTAEQTRGHRRARDHVDAISCTQRMKEEETQRMVQRQAETMIKLEQEKNAAQAEVELLA